MNKKGFTLIELLAVIVILGIILVIAIPSISKAILNSRKSAYVATANEFVDGLRLMTLNDPSLLSSCKGLSEIKLEKGSSTKSPFGKNYKEESKVCVNYNSETNEYDYSVCLVDEGGNRICNKDENDDYVAINIKDVTKDSVVVGGASGVSESSFAKNDYGYASDDLVVLLDGINNTNDGHNNSTTTWYDLSGNGNNPIFPYNSSILSWGDKYYHLQAYVFQFQNNPNSFNNQENSWTIETRIKREDSFTGGVDVLFGNCGAKSFALIITPENYVGIINSPYNFNIYVSTLSINNDETTTITITYTPGTLKFYKNSNLVSTVSATIETPTIIPWFGNWSSSSCANNYFYGNLYSFRIYQRVLTDDEIESNYQNDQNRF